MPLSLSRFIQNLIHCFIQFFFKSSHDFIPSLQEFEHLEPINIFILPTTKKPW